MEAVDIKYVAADRRETAAGYAASLIILMKPGIVAAVLLAGFTGMVLAAGGWPDARTGLLCLAALFLSAAGSAMLNGVLDLPLDMRMARVQTRVAALGRAGRGRVIALALAAIGVAMLIACRCLNPLSSLFILAAVVSYTLVYTLRLKRRSPWGAVPGGIPGALPVLIGYAAAADSVRPDGLILFVVILLWQPPHFWTLALRYRRDYAAAGVPVMPVMYGERYTTLLIFVYATAMIPASLLLWLFGFCTAWYAGVALLLGAALLATCYLTIVRTDRFALAFGASILYLVFLLAAVVGDICLVQGGMPRL